MTRRPIPSLGAAALASLLAACAPGPPPATAPRPSPNVDAARELDQLGVRSFRDGRFADAARYFRAAFDLGGPSTELWNVARSAERRDDLEGAETALDAYVGRPDLTPGDRAEAERELQSLRGRPSTLTVTTTPEGAALAIDGKPGAGTTPFSIEIAPGTHAIEVQKDGFAEATRTIEARLGRAVVVSLDLFRAEK